MALSKLLDSRTLSSHKPFSNLVSLSPNRITRCLLKGLVRNFVVIVLYVDDIIVAGPDVDVLTETKTFLHSQFKLKDLGSLKFFLGLEIAHSSAGIIVSQRQYAL